MDSDSLYQAILAIRRTQGSNAKKAVLSGFPAMRNMLRTTYSPFIQFGLTPSENWITECGEEQFSEKTSGLLQDLASGTLTGNRARNAVKAHLKDLTYDSGRLLLMILEKSFSFGLAIKSINEVFPGLVPTHPIQLAKPFEMRKCKFPCLISPKLDGLRAKFKGGTFYSRKGHKFVGLTALTENMRILIGQLRDDLPPYSEFEFDGELMVDGEHFNEISGQIRAFTEADNAHYYIFDVPCLQQPQWLRCAFLDRLALTRSFPNITFVPHTTVTSLDAIHLKYGEYQAQGYEGAIVKQEQGLYQDARTWDWMKLKSTETADCRVLDVFEGEGKYKGMVGGLVVNFNGKQVRVGSGLKDSQRMYWWDDQDEIIGRVVEVAYHEVTPDGSLRHPRFKCIRGDK